MPRPVVPQVYTLDIAEVLVDQTGSAKYNGETRHGWPFAGPSPWSEGRIEWGVDFDSTDTELDLHCRNYSKSEDVVVLNTVTSDVDRSVQTFNPDEVGSGDEIGVQVDVNSASASQGAQAFIAARVILRP